MIRLRFRSIAARLVTLHVLAVLVASASLPLLMLFLLDSAADRLRREALREQAEEVARYLRKERAGSWHVELPPAVQAQYLRGYGRYAYAVVSADGHTVQSSLGNRAIGELPQRQEQPVFFPFEEDRAHWAAISLPFDIGGERVWVQTAINLAYRDVLMDDVVSGFLHQVGWVVVPALALLLLVDLIIFRRALTPLNEASDMVERIGPLRVDLRLPVAGMPRELLPLVSGFNQALDRLEHGFRLQRQFTADAAHELRTPLAILLAHVDTMEDKQVAGLLRQDINAMRRLVDQLLDSAELEVLTVAPEERADLVAVCSEVAGFLAPLALGQGREIAVTGSAEPVWVRGNAEALFRAVRNLAENALRHTPKGTEVEIEVTERGAIRVMDRGPGVAEADRPLLFRRFWRRDRRDTGRAGLGLSIVARIAEAHSGGVLVQAREGGGAVFALDLSAALLEKPAALPSPASLRPAPSPLRGEGAEARS